MSILNVNKIQPVGSGQTVTISAANIDIGSSTFNVGAGKSIRLYGATSGYSEIVAAAGSASTTFTLPANGGSASQYLQTDGSGGLSWAGVTTGKILQVVSTTKVDSFDTTSLTFVDVTGLSVDITPSSTSNKVLVLVHMMVSANWWTEIPGINLVRGSTNICQSTGGTALNATAIPISYEGSASSSSIIIPQSIVFLDSPATTSSTTYKIQVEQMSVNRRKINDTTGGTSTITVMEVAG